MMSEEEVMTDQPDRNMLRNTPSMIYFNSKEQTLDRNVEIARILGWTDIERHVGAAGNVYWTGGLLGRFAGVIPDFRKEPAFILRTMEANRLAVDSDSPHSPLDWVAYAPCNDDLGSIIGRGTSVADAVLNWICAADKAGVKVRQ